MTVMSFVPIDRWTVRSGNISVQWRARPTLSPRRLAEILENQDFDEIRQALGRFRPSGVRSAEGTLIELLQHSADEAVVSGAARLLRYGTTSASLRALERALPEAITRQQDASVVEAVAALYWRHRPESIRELARYAEDIDPERLGRIVGFSLMRDLPTQLWSDHLLSRMEGTATARFIAARIKFSKGDKIAERILRDALSGNESERQMGVAALASVGSKEAHEMLHAALGREQDLSLQLMMCACLGNDCSAAMRMLIITQASTHQDPYLRYQAALQLGLLPARVRREVVRQWLAREPDNVIRYVLRKARTRASSRSGRS